MRQFMFGPLSLILLSVVALLAAATASAQAAPVVAAVSVPANGYYRAGDNLTFMVHFSENVTVTGTPSLSVVIGSSSRAANYLGGSGTSALAFGYTVQPGDMDLDGVSLGAMINLNGGTIENAGGEAADTTLNNVASTSNVFVNTQQPSVAAAVLGNPPSNATQVTFQIVFSEAVTGFTLSDMVLTATGTASATLTSLQTSDNITYTVLAQAISGSGTLRLDVPANSAQNNAGNGNLAAASAPWTVGASSNADLSQLQPSQGSLSPAFSANTLSYSISVPHNVTAITLTPVVSEPNATVTVNGSPVASGSASMSVSLAVGSTAIPVVVTAQDGTMKTYNVDVIRSALGVTAASRTVTVMAGTTVAVDLTAGATGAPFTAAALTFLPNPEAGKLYFDAAQKRLSFTASPSFAGSTQVGFTLSNASGTSAQATITFAVAARPDPTEDSDVIGLLNAQADAARDFAQYQTRNFNNRLEQLHDEGERQRRSFDIRLGLRRSDNGGSSGGPNGGPNGGIANAERQFGWPGGSAPDLVNPALSRRQGDSTGIQGMDPGPFAVWSGGFVDFADTGNSGPDIGSTTVGVSAGVDYRFSDRFVAGFGLGYGHDKSDVGDDGTESRGAAYSAAIYGSFKAADNLFLDGLVGASRLDFDSSRYISSSGDFAEATRDGRQMFASLTAAYEFRNRTWLVSPYGRFELSRSWLDGFTESGGGIYDLTYGNQTVDTAAGVIGLRLSYTLMTDWGMLTPGARAEYTHDFAGSSRMQLGYADTGTLPYEFEAEDSGDDYASLGLSLDAALLNNWAVGVEYRASIGSGRQDHAVGIRVSSQF
ncbi:autotransporter domain-containing protein [Rhizobium sp. BK418]|uniref:autotransporter domain-containing protein n=1 Tax=Rhizobium sp. BK418 TaxID=2512120 RepID=UPI0010F225DA|nr:autotransporter domain-containing protein [Rhizobium sp. BK418]TCS09210.1 outer membrane autotransporter protein [Rhizobium sp. BK418]